MVSYTLFDQGMIGAAQPIASSATIPFVPTDLSLMLGWWKADALSLNSGDAVTSFTDSSGKGNHFTAAGGARPTFKTGSINGNPALTFNGTAQAMSVPSLTLSASNAVTIFSVFNLQPTIIIRFAGSTRI